MVRKERKMFHFANGVARAGERVLLLHPLQTPSDPTAYRRLLSPCVRADIHSKLFVYTLPPTRTHTQIHLLKIGTAYVCVCVYLFECVEVARRVGLYMARRAILTYPTRKNPRAPLT